MAVLDLQIMELAPEATRGNSASSKGCGNTSHLSLLLC